LASEVAPAAVKLHVVADLDSELPEIAVEYRHGFAGTRAAFHRFAVTGDHQVHLIVCSGHAALPIERHRGIRAALGVVWVSQISRYDDVAAVLAGDARERVAHRTVKRDSMRHRLTAHLARDRRLGKNGQVEIAAVLALRLPRHAIHHAG